MTHIVDLLVVYTGCVFVSVLGSTEALEKEPDCRISSGGGGGHFLRRTNSGVSYTIHMCGDNVGVIGLF